MTNYIKPRDLYAAADIAENGRSVESIRYTLKTLHERALVDDPEQVAVAWDVAGAMRMYESNNLDKYTSCPVTAGILRAAADYMAKTSN